MIAGTLGFLGSRKTTPLIVKFAWPFLLNGFSSATCRVGEGFSRSYVLDIKSVHMSMLSR